MDKNKIKFVNPFAQDDDDFEWLELENLPSNVHNPFLYPVGASIPDPVDEFINLFTNADYLHAACYYILNVELLPYQMAILDTLWRRRMPMLIGTRGGAKSYILAVYILLRMILNPGCRVVIVGAGLRQSRQVFDYMVHIWQNAPILRDLAGKSKTTGPRREVDRYQFELGDSRCFAIPIGDGTKIRGLRANYIIADEFASIPEEIFNLVVQGFGVVSQNPVQKIKEAATVKKLKRMGAWTPEMEKLRWENAEGNQIVYSGTAFYSFNHFYKYFKVWHDIISSKGKSELAREIFGDNLESKGFGWKDFAVIRMPYTHVPEGLLDEGIVAQAKATLSRNQFYMEYGAIFATDSDGFYKRSVIEGATTNKPIILPGGVKVQFRAGKSGDAQKAHVIAIDPAADADNAAIVILEMNKDHRRIVHCWTTNKKKHDKQKKRFAAKGVILEDDYYRYIARKVRSLMREFKTEHIIMDKNGGGTAIAEALASIDTLEPGELPVYQIIDPEEPKADDAKHGLHILELLAPTNEINADANHGMLKDLQDKVLLFPLFDVVELAQAIELEGSTEEDDVYDTYEDLLHEIEELKVELTSIVVTPSSALGKETFDTPAIKGVGDRKGRLRKDRYSALLYANYYARNKGKDDVFKIDYKPVGSSNLTARPTIKADSNEMMYYGPGMLKAKSGHDWIKGSGYKMYRKQK
jgi:hypothetical protein